jgi:hypothetical protein
LAQGVDDPTWLFHLKRGDYTSWLRDVIKDGELADEVRRAESDPDAAGSRARVMEAIKRRYAAANLA